MAHPLPGLLALAPEVDAALRDGRPVVALESTLVTHGLPYPTNLEVALASEEAIRARGAVPATVAVGGGRLLVGLDTVELEALASAPADTVRKVSRGSLGAALAARARGGTTVAATMIAAAAAGIGVFATGGIGGVHRGAIGGARPTLDISADLEELARTSLAVVCAGPKAILDVGLTLEYLETRGVPVATIGADELPGFYARGSGHPTPLSLPDVTAAAALVRAHRALGLGSSVLLCVPLPEADAVPDDVARDVVSRAVAEAEQAGMDGPALTPWLLARVAELTSGASLRANAALIVNDARVAAELAVALSAPAPAA
jgi:pseudouridine-5'-phosphate glycosidase